MGELDVCRAAFDNQRQALERDPHRYWQAELTAELVELEEMLTQRPPDDRIVVAGGGSGVARVPL